MGFHCFVVVGFLFLTIWSFVCFALSERMKGFCDFHQGCVSAFTRGPQPLAHDGLFSI